jgi:hypothetical protein
VIQLRRKNICKSIKNNWKIVEPVHLDRPVDILQKNFPQSIKTTIETVQGLEIESQANREIDQEIHENQQGRKAQKLTQSW